MRLDLGGIAKGYAADQAMAILKQHGIKSALVAASGDIVVSAPPPGKKGWTVAIAPLTTHDSLRGFTPPARPRFLIRVRMES